MSPISWTTNKVRSALNSARQNLGSRLFFDLGGSDDVVLVSGVGRSGTTWVQELLNYSNDFRVMFEPFYPQKVADVSEWKYKQYFAPGQKEPNRFRDAAANLFSGQVRNPWIDRYNQSLFPKRRLIKDIRTNLLLPWIRREFPQVPIILVIRHPFSVAASRVRLGWQSQNDVYWNQAKLVERHLSDFQNCYQECETDFEHHVFGWCVETLVPLRELRPGDAQVFFYESLVQDPQHQIPRLLEYADVKFNDRALQAALIPSAQSRWEQSNRRPDKLAASWETGAKVLAGGQRILNAFGLDRIYDGDGLPAVSPKDLLGLLNCTVTDNEIRS